MDGLLSTGPNPSSMISCVGNFISIPIVSGTKLVQAMRAFTFLDWGVFGAACRCRDAVFSIEERFDCRLSPFICG